MFSLVSCISGIQVLNTPIWILSLYKKTLTIASLNTLRTIILSIAVRIFNLLSFLVPLKAILIAGNGSLPRGLQGLLPGLSMNNWVILFVVITIIFYLISVLLQQLLDKYLVKGAKLISSRNQKVSSSINVPLETEIAYNETVKSLSALSFFCIAASVVTLLNPKLALMLICAFLTPWLLLFAALRYLKRETNILLFDNLRIVQKRWVFLTFITIFVLIVVDLIDGNSDSSVLFALITFILSRYAISAANEFTTSIFRIVTRKEKINSVMFFKTPATGNQLVHQNDASFLSITTAKYFASQLIEELHLDHKICALNLNSYSVFGVFCLNLRLEVDANESKKLTTDYIIKIFQPRYNFLAQHETQLLRSRDILLMPAPKILAKKSINNYECLLFEPVRRQANTKEEYKKALISVLCQMWSIPSTNAVLNSYARTHGSSIQKLKHSNIEMLKLICADDLSLTTINELQENFDSVKNYVLALPLALHNPQLTMNTVSIETSNNLSACCQWGRWSVEPIGTTLWQFDFISDDDLDQVLNFIRKHREDCKDIDKNQLRLGAAAYKLWKLLESQKFTEALEAARNVLKLYRRLQLSEVYF